ncbi:flagellar hook-length control protein FliK [Pseudomonas sp. SWI44]|uniref:flagellar hook-length control protein FliK n=1 Tax=Pseudomonas sp. SWI44 TaxID=2083053 RepID=UPI000CE5FACC|nr:flagellar hook-length control protein FliK [Pseudomonas sp. SWI44]AVD88284.1 hypothetical protein C4Q26_14445 [Pseudomonas sp. SWI44]
MNIITNLAAQPLVATQDVTDNSSADNQTSAFSTVLQQAQTASADTPATSVANAAAPARPKPIAPSPTDRHSEPVSQVPQTLVQAEADEQQQDLLPAATVQPPAPAADLPFAELDTSAEESVTTDKFVPMLENADSAEGSTDANDGTEPSQDSLEAIRQRLDLIDNAGVIAIAVPVTGAQAPAASPDPTLAAEPTYESKATAGVEWKAPAEEPFAVEPDLVIDIPAEVVSVATHASLETTNGNTVDSLPTDSLDATPTLPTAISGLSSLPTTSSSAVSDAASTAATPTLGSTTWQNDLGQQVIALIRRGEQQMDMQLNPADLGPLSISLNVSDGGIQAQFQSAHASVRSAVEQALPQLQVALAAQGLTLGEASINDGASRQAMGEQSRQESSGADDRSRPESSAEPAAVPKAQPIVSLGAGVDLYL